MNFYWNILIISFHKFDLTGDYSMINKIILTTVRSFVKTHLLDSLNIENRIAFVRIFNFTSKEVR